MSVVRGAEAAEGEAMRTTAFERRWALTHFERGILEYSIAHDLRDAVRLLRKAREWVDDGLVGPLGGEIDDFLREPKSSRKEKP